MTKKDFELIAGIIARVNITDDVRAQLALAFARELMATNPRFDATRFYGRAQETR